ncbi:MAG: nucleotidyltransferase family protein [Lachnospiraceae bacterium]|nr:nucleotidyltransferase family protein [Lachnospiraceae bacterium]
MKVTGLITEYNPLHLGHRFHLREARRQTNADYLIVVMSGNFTQRGIPAVTDKYLRTAMALAAGADLVLELPLWPATSSAEYFAAGGVTLLHRLGVVTHLAFGCENNNMQRLWEYAALLGSETPEFKKQIRLAQKQGISYPRARAAALSSCLSHRKEGEASLDSAFFSSPNNILGVEYCKALQSLQSHISPVAILRQGHGYHDTSLAHGEGFLSASALRSHLLNVYDQTAGSAADFSSDSAASSLLRESMPRESADMLTKTWGISTPVGSNDFSLLLKYRLLSLSSEELSEYADVSGPMADRMMGCFDRFTDFEGFCSLLKTKNLTYTRISRGLLHILLDMKERQRAHYVQKNHPGYARVLGFKKTSTPLLKEIKQKGSIPLLSKPADARLQLPEESLSWLRQEIYASHIYETVVADKFKRPFRNEYQRQILIWED